MDAIIVGAGMSGLTCASDLLAQGKRVICLDASDRVGGRIRTDQIDGFLIDRGFQILISSYPEVKRKLDLDALNLGLFKPGAMVRFEGSWHTVCDPLREPAYAFASAIAPVGSINDKIKVTRLKSELQNLCDEELLKPTSLSACRWLTEYGFSDEIKTRFFKPFFSGALLDPELSTDAGLIKFLYKMFSSGSGCLPEKGMQAVPDQLANRFPLGTLRLKTRVTKITERAVHLESGETISADHIVLACDLKNTAQLWSDIKPATHSRSCTTFYFACDRALIQGPWLLLNGEGKGLINNAAFLSEIQSSYAPEGQSLFCATTIGSDTSDRLQEIQTQLEEWFGPEAKRFRHLKTGFVADALPSPTNSAAHGHHPLPPWLSIIGDFTESPSLQGAMLSGARRAKAICLNMSAHLSKI